MTDFFADDLRADKMQQAHEAAQERKCGTCKFFVVRPPEVEIAQIARPMAACQPGSHCSGGPVRGMCMKWKERGAPTPQMESTQLCPLYQPGGPSVLGAGSFQRDEAAAKAALAGQKRGFLDGVEFFDGTHATLAVVGVLALASWWKGRK
jgi:hypothetical protein